MARVIFLMFPTARIFRLIARTDKTAPIVLTHIPPKPRRRRGEGEPLFERTLEFFNGLLQTLLRLGFELLRGPDRLADRRVILRQVLQQALLEGLDPVDRDAVEVAVR